MSVDYRAKLAYGVQLTERETNAIRLAMEELDGYEDMVNPYLIVANWYDSYESSHIIGIVMNSVGEGDSRVVDFKEPDPQDLAPALGILNLFHIDRKPTWHLLCEVS